MPCRCASINPGITVFPARLISCVFWPDHFFICSLSPTAIICCPFTASAWALGCWSSSVISCPLYKMTSAFSCEYARKDAPINNALNVALRIAGGGVLKKKPILPIIFISPLCDDSQESRCTSAKLAICALDNRRSSECPQRALPDRPSIVVQTKSVRPGASSGWRCAIKS